MDIAAQTPRCVGARGSRAPPTHRILKFIFRSFALDSVLLTEGRILNPFYEIRE
jgi:hypothetical protein